MMPRVLFLSRLGIDDRSAYTHRLCMLRNGLEKLGVKTGFLNLAEQRITSHTMLPIYIPLLLRIFREYDIIHAGGTPCAFVANIFKLLHGKKVVYDVHGDCIGEIQQNIATNKSKSILKYFALLKAFVQEIGATYFSDLYLVVSKPLKKMIHSRGVTNVKIKIIRNGVDLNLFFPYYSNIHSCLYVTYAGQFQTYQAINHFIEAVQKIDNSRIKFHIIGFTEKDRQKKEIIKNQLGHKIELIDRTSQFRLVKLLQESDVLVIPREYSRVTSIAFPTKFAEYISIGKPVIVADVDETAQFVRDYHCGWVYRNCSEDLIRVLKNVVNLPKHVLIQMGKNGRSLAKNIFDWNIICNEYSQILSTKYNK